MGFINESRVYARTPLSRGSCLFALAPHGDGAWIVGEVPSDETVLSWPELQKLYPQVSTTGSVNAQVNDPDRTEQSIREYFLSKLMPAFTDVTPNISHQSMSFTPINSPIVLLAGAHTRSLVSGDRHGISLWKGSDWNSFDVITKLFIPRKIRAGLELGDTGLPFSEAVITLSQKGYQVTHVDSGESTEYMLATTIGKDPYIIVAGQNAIVAHAMVHVLDNDVDVQSSNSFSGIEKRRHLWMLNQFGEGASIIYKPHISSAYPDDKDKGFLAVVSPRMISGELGIPSDDLLGQPAIAYETVSQGVRSDAWF